jgi:hypothetical protein
MLSVYDLDDLDILQLLFVFILGKLYLPNDKTFFINDLSNSYNFNIELADNKKFPSIVAIIEPDVYYECVKATVNNRKLELRVASCGEDIGVVCRVEKMSNLNVECNGTSISNENMPLNDNNLEYVFNPKYKDDIMTGATRQKTAYKDLFRRLNQTAVFKSMFSMLWYSTIPCFDVKGVTSETDGEKGMLRYCQWKGKPIPCSAIFTQVRK